MFDQIVGGIHIQEMEDPPDLIDVTIDKDLFFSRDFTSEFLLRRIVYKKIKVAQSLLPPGYHFMIFEAFRSRTRQLQMWDNILQKLRNENVHWDETTLQTAAGRLVADPHGFGSGHQAGAAVDITLCSDRGEEWPMGTKVQEFNAQTQTLATGLTQKEIEGRHILCKALESQGIVNYPDEWWHFSYGDRLWAEITSRDRAFFAPLD